MESLLCLIEQVVRLARLNVAQCIVNVGRVLDLGLDGKFSLADSLKDVIDVD